MSESFNKRQYAVEGFIDLPKLFETVADELFLNKLNKFFGIIDKNLHWFKSYIVNIKQYID